MSHQNQTISFRLRDRIERVTSLVSTSIKTQFSKSGGSSYALGWNYVEQKPVRSSSTYLYSLSRYNDRHPTLGFSFRFYDEYEYKNVLPIEMQTVQFSICLNDQRKGEDKVVQYSKPFDLVEAREILKELEKQLLDISSSNRNHSKGIVNAECFIGILTKVVFNLTPASLKEKEDQIVSEFKDQIISINNQKQNLIDKKNSLSNAQSLLDSELENDEDLIEIKELEERVSKLRAKRNDKRKSLTSKYNIKGLRNDVETLKTDVNTATEKLLKETQSYSNKNDIPFTVLHEMRKVYGKEE